MSGWYSEGTVKITHLLYFHHPLHTGGSPADDLQIINSRWQVGTFIESAISSCNQAPCLVNKINKQGSTKLSKIKAEPIRHVRESKISVSNPC
jgi:hypothetical protein